MSGTKIPNVSNLFRETKHFNSCVRINACVTQFLKIRAISSIDKRLFPEDYMRTDSLYTDYTRIHIKQLFLLSQKER